MHAWINASSSKQSNGRRDYDGKGERVRENIKNEHQCSYFND